MKVIRRIEIDAGHRLLKHEGKCRNLHGHRYVFEVEAQSKQLDSVGRGIDFSIL
jgi:6-pyruvoyltetrahydropterin/6-carboxytetrahydropterin synthase